MNINEVKQCLNKTVYYRLSPSSKPSPFIFNAYIFRVNPKNRKERLHEAELLDTDSNSNNGSLLIVSLDNVIVE